MNKTPWQHTSINNKLLQSNNVHANIQIYIPLMMVIYMLYSHDHYTYTYKRRNIFNTIRTSEDSSLEKYTSHFIWKGSKGLQKVLLCERWVGDWTELQHIDPHSYAGAAQPGPWGLAFLGHGPHSSIFSPTATAQSAGCWFSLLHLISNWLELSMHRIILLFYAHSIQLVNSQGYPLDTFDRMHLLFTQVHFFFWQLGRVGGQYTTVHAKVTSLLQYTHSWWWPKIGQKVTRVTFRYGSFINQIPPDTV